MERTIGVVIMNEVEKFWSDSQSQTIKKFGVEQEKAKDLSLDLLKTIITVHATILGISIALMGYLQKNPNLFLLFTWIAEVACIALGLLCFKLHIDEEIKNSLENFMFSYDTNEINMREARSEFVGKEKEREGLIVAAMMRRWSPDEKLWTPYAQELAEKYKAMLPCSKIFKETKEPSMFKKFLNDKRLIIVNVFYLLTSLSFLFLLISILVK